MDDYEDLCREIIKEHIRDSIMLDGTKTAEDVLTDMLENGNEDVFGNFTGSRTCNTYEAQEFINKSGAIWDDDILSLFEDLGDDYFTDTLKRGPETLDVVILELLSNQVINEMLEGLKK